MNDTIHRIPSHHPGAVARVFGDDAVILSPTENKVRMLNATGSRIWALADGSRTLEQIASILVQEYDINPDSAQEEVVNFVEELVTKGLMDWSQE